MSVFPVPTDSSTGNLGRQRVGGRRAWWWQRLRRVFAALGHDNISIMAAGTAYYLLLSIFPGMSALVLTYGLIADPVSIERHVTELANVMPTEALKLLSDQLHTLVTAAPEKLGIGLVISILFALWTGTSGIVAMMQALTVAYEGREDRGLFHFYGLAFGLTIGLVLFGLAALVLIAGVPAVVTRLPMPEFWRQLLPLVRWPILAALALVGLGTLYRIAPNRDPAGWDFLRPGTIAASLLWLVGSAGFSFYVAESGSYDRTYGSLGAVAVLMVWLYASAYIVLAGAELNSEIERANAAAKTPGPPETSR